MHISLIGTAALALAAGALHADPGDNGKGKRGDHAAAQRHGIDPDRVTDKAPDKGPGRAHDTGPTAGKPDLPSVGRRDAGPTKQARAIQDHPIRMDTGKPGNGARNTAPAKASVMSKGGIDRAGQSRKNRVAAAPRDFRWASLTIQDRLIKGCPPGLAERHSDCLPPGKARQISWHRPEWFGSLWNGSDRYRYYHGYMLRMGSDNQVLSYVPLLGGALSAGEVWPSAYEPVSLPPYYVDYFGLGPADGYRYYGDTIYRVDPATSAIESIAALLTGQDFVVGDPMPSGYDVYNVPYPYRDRYRDSPAALYRYSDGYIYRVDPETRLITAAIELLT